MESSTGELLVLTTVASSDQAAVFAREMVEKNLAACVTCLPGAVSFFRWQSDTVAEEPEMVLVIKTHQARLPELEAFFHERHPYECPEFVAVEIAALTPAYANWLHRELHLEPR